MIEFRSWSKSQAFPLFKIMNGMDRLDPHNFFIFLHNNTRGHSQKVFMGQCRLDL